MVQVPVYRQQVRQEAAPDTRLGLRQAPNMATVQGVQNLASGIARASSVYDQVAQEERRKADDAQIVKAVGDATELGNNLHLELRKNKLSDAVKNSPQFEEKHQAGLDEIAKNLGSDDQRAAFNNWRARSQPAFNAAVRSYAYDQGEKSDDIDYSNTKDALSRKAATFADPSHGEEGIRQVQDVISEMAATNAVAGRRKGLNDDQIAELNRADNSNVQAMVISTWNDSGYSLQAKAYFDAHKDELDPKTRNDLGKALEVGTLRAQGQRTADEIVNGAIASASTTEGVFMGDWAGTYTQAMAGVQSIQDPKLRDEVEGRVERALNLRQRVENEAEAQRFTGAWDIIKKPGTTIDSIPAADWARMDTNKREHLQRMIDFRNGKEPDRDTADRSWLEFNDMVGEDGGASLSKMDAATLEATYRPRMERDKWERVVAVWTASREPKKAAELDSFLSANDRFNEAMTMAEIDPKADPIATARIKRAVDREIQTMSAAKGKKLGPDEEQLAVDRVFLRRVMVSEWGRDSRKMTASLSDDEKGNAYLPIAEIPAADQSHLRSKYPGATDDKIQRAYAAHLMGDNARADAIMKGK